jgi:hypothetical protein
MNLLAELETSFLLVVAVVVLELLVKTLYVPRVETVDQVDHRL